MEPRKAKTVYRPWSRRTTVVIFLLVIAAAFSRSSAQDQGQQKPSVLTPPERYSDPEWSALSKKYEKNLEALQKTLSEKFGDDRFRLLTTEESAVGGVGFWPIPIRFGEQVRYLGLFAKMTLPPPSPGMPFPDTETGRIMLMMDAFGKESIYAIAKELKKIKDPKVTGAALIFIYGKKPLGDPGFEDEAEALSLFMKRDDVITFASLRMTLQTLFSRSEMLPILTGREQITNLRLYIIQP